MVDPAGAAEPPRAAAPVADENATPGNAQAGAAARAAARNANGGLGLGGRFSARTGGVGKKRARASQGGAKEMVFQWKAQQAGLPKEVRQESKELMKTGLTAAQRAKQAADEAAKQAAAAATLAAMAAAAAAGQPQPAAAVPPKRSHHKQYDSLLAELPQGWERKPKTNGAVQLFGIRKSVPKSVREAAAKTKGKHGRKMEFRFTPKDEARNAEFCKAHGISKIQVMTKGPLGTQRTPHT